jgi:hypothetical protein
MEGSVLLSVSRANTLVGLLSLCFTTCRRLFLVLACCDSYVYLCPFRLTFPGLIVLVLFGAHFVLSCVLGCSDCEHACSFATSTACSYANLMRAILLEFCIRCPVFAMHSDSVSSGLTCICALVYLSGRTVLDDSMLLLAIQLALVTSNELSLFHYGYCSCKKGHVLYCHRSRNAGIKRSCIALQKAFGSKARL